MGKNYGYGSYRGRSRFRAFLKVMIAVLALLLILLVAAYFYLQQYIVVTSDGVRLELPFFRSQSPEPEPSLIVISPEPSVPIIVTPTPTPTPEPEPEYTRSAAMPESLLRSGGLEALYAEGGDTLGAYTGGYDGVTAIFTLKGSNGKLGYVSESETAKALRTSSADPALNEDLRATTGQFYAAAYLSCFQDDSAPYNRNSLALRSNVGNWRGPGNLRWMSPQSEGARAYLAEICGELAGLGFRELILDYSAFPAEGNLDWIVRGDRYDPETFSETMEEFYGQVREALKDYPYLETAGTGTRLSIVTDKTTLDEGANETTGQTLEMLCRYADRLYVDLEGEDPEQYYDALREAGMENPEEDLVVILPAPPENEPAYSWAVLPEE